MTENFDSFLKKLYEDIDSVSSVFGNDGAYDTQGDSRIPKSLLPMQRRINKKHGLGKRSNRRRTRKR